MADDVARVEIEDSIDLHGFQPRDVLSVVDSYLEAAAEKGFVEVRLIHGRGTGFQRARVRELLAEHPWWSASRMPRPPAAAGAQRSSGCAPET